MSDQRRAIWLFALVGLLPGCAGRGPGGLTLNERAEHVITVDADGVPVDPTTYAELGAGDFGRQLDAVTTAIDRSGKKKILLFVHGGLNNREAAQRHVDELLGPMRADGYHPLFLNWNSDLVDTAREDLLYIRQGRTARILGPLSAPLAVLMAVGSGLLRAPLVWGQMLSSDINASGLYDFPGKANSAAIQAKLLELQQQHHDARIPLEIGEEQIGRWDSAGAALRYTVTLPSKLLLSPIIDGLGQAAWRNMMRRTQMLFHREDEFDIRDRRDPRAVQEYLLQGPRGAAHRLFSRLESHLRSRSGVELTLIGHSMGTIVLNRALRQFPELPVRHIVYLAAACSVDDFQTSVIPYLARHREESHFYNLTLHPSAEVREWQKALLDLTPRGSLLVWIDNFLGDPTTTLDRTLGSWENLMQTAHVIPTSVRPQVTLKAFGIGGPARPGTPATPTTHGGFTDKAMRFWCPQVWTVPGEDPLTPCAMAAP
jgi:pimeloyl-ACP methyl ester carboxylesterase